MEQMVIEGGFRPTGDNVVVLFDQRPEMTPSGLIWLAPTADSKEKWSPTRGTVLSAGPGRPLKAGGISKADVKPGDRVLFPEWSWRAELELNGEACLIFGPDSLLALLEDE